MAALTIASCGTTPVTPQLHEPEKPDYPHFTEAEINTLKTCVQDDKPTCTVQDATLIKMRDKDIQCRGYAAEAIRVIKVNNAEAMVQ
ncbi:MAG: hypothetical protein SV201_05725 [Pseudomonadota bacterium]|nr:hypothetical protein [Pseudomonadota bacterium]